MGLQPSASKTDLLLQCGRPFADDTEIEPRPAGADARYGSAVHLLQARNLAPKDKRYRNVTAAGALEKFGLPTDGAADVEAHAEISTQAIRNFAAGENEFHT